MARLVRTLAAAAAGAALAGVLAGPAQAQQATGYSGSLPDGATWVADVPSDYNGTIILYSHGFGPLTAQDAPDPATKADLLELGYALVGSSYSGNSLWALASAQDDQFAALSALEHHVAAPRHVIAWGTSMGGLVSAEEAQDGHGRIDGALTTCGLVAGALNLNNYQLDGEYALRQLLAPGQSIPLVRYTSADDASAAGTALATVTAQAQNTPQGQARIALAAALLNEPTWYTSRPPAGDYAAQEQQQEQELTNLALGFEMGGRYQIELAAGGNSSFTTGVDYRSIMDRSPFGTEVRSLYRAAGLDLDKDLDNLTTHANITPDPAAIATLGRTSTVTGHLDVPELDIHTVADQLIPVEQENWYRQRVAAAGSGRLLRQAYVGASGHCAFEPADYLAALHALEHRIDTGRWDHVTDAEHLNQAATATQLGNFSPYWTFQPPALANARSVPATR